MTTTPTDASADVLVVGSGVIGLSTAHHLATLGRRVTLVDAGALGEGTTAAGAGFVGLWAAGYAHYWDERELALEQYGIDFYRDLGRRDSSVLLRENGNMYLSTTDSGYRRFIAPMGRHPHAPADSRLLTPEEVSEVTDGQVLASGVTGGFLQPQGIQIDAPAAVRALLSELELAGVDLRPHHAVERVLVEDGRVAGVAGSFGVLRAPSVVIAAGSWTNNLLAPIGWSLPLMRVVASRILTDPVGVPPTIPTLMLPDQRGLWVREHNGGWTYGDASGYRPFAELQAGTPPLRPEFPELVHALRNELSTFLPRLLSSIPDPEAIERRWVQGVVSMTPDRRFLAGAVPNIGGLFAAAGCNESGVTHGPGIGRLVADLVTTGSSAFDKDRYRLDRFMPDLFEHELDIAKVMPPRRAVTANLMTTVA